MLSFRKNRYLVLLSCGVVIAVILAINVCYFVAAFQNTSYCDHILDGIPLLQHIMSCKPCPYHAKCVDDTAQCPSNYHLDEYGVICLPNIGDKADNAADVAHFVNCILNDKLEKVDEASLISEIKDKYIDVVGDDDDDDDGDKPLDNNHNIDDDDDDDINQFIKFVLDDNGNINNDDDDEKEYDDPLDDPAVIESLKIHFPSHSDDEEKIKILFSCSTKYQKFYWDAATFYAAFDYAKTEIIPNAYKHKIKRDHDGNYVSLMYSDKFSFQYIRFHSVRV